MQNDAMKTETFISTALTVIYISWQNINQLIWHILMCFSEFTFLSLYFRNNIPFSETRILRQVYYTYILGSELTLHDVLSHIPHVLY